MTQRRMRITSLCLFSAALFAWIGCASSAPNAKKPPPSHADGTPEALFPRGFLLVEPGAVDFDNAYLTSVMVQPVFINEKGRATSRACSGVLVHPRLVLTAGHCICAPRLPRDEDRAPDSDKAKPSKSIARDRKASEVITRAAALKDVTITNIIDGRSSCARTATVITVAYAPYEGGQGADPKTFASLGEVAIHPHLELVLGKRTEAASVVWSNADLAAIFLERPMGLDLPRLEMANAEVQIDDTISMVGFGPGAASKEYGIRQFGENKVTRLIQLETGSAVFRVEEQHLPDGGSASHTLRGDSGGACFKKTNKNVLVGISTVGAEKVQGGRMSIFTSIYAHRSWLSQMIKKADES